MNSQVWLIGFIATIAVFQIVAIPSLIMKRNDFVDVAWGPGFPIAAFFAIIFGANGFSNIDTRTLIIFVLVTIWALRLFFHIGLRNLTHSEEDIRYRNWRKEWGSTWLWRSYLQVFVLQSVIQCLFLTSVLLAIASEPKPMGAIAYLGILVWLVGFLFESIGDEQLRRFKSDSSNKGKMMTTGLWSWTRHPNYFGEVTQWWGIWLLVLELPYGWATLISPLAVTFIIIKISGVDMLERLMKNRPGFAEYAKRTSVFFPRPPKN